jgi:hypothetical protein
MQPHVTQFARFVQSDGSITTAPARAVFSAAGELVRWDMIDEGEARECVDAHLRELAAQPFPHIEPEAGGVLLRSRERGGHTTRREQEAVLVLEAAGVKVRVSWDCQHPGCMRAFGHTGDCLRASDVQDEESAS